MGGWVIRKAVESYEIFATYHTRVLDMPGVTWRCLDVRDERAVHALVREVDPEVILHTAALNPGQGEDFDSVNAQGTRHIARAARAYGARLIHVSTDMVFDGKRGNYVEEDSVCPITPYGCSKARAEEEVLNAHVEAVLVRTSLVYGWEPELSRSVRWILEELEEGKQVRLFTDERRCPIWVESLADALVELASMSITGILHVAGGQVLSRYQFGEHFLRLCGIDMERVEAASSREMGLNRPLECTLDCSRARSLLYNRLPGMDQVLQDRRPCLVWRE